MAVQDAKILILGGGFGGLFSAVKLYQSLSISGPG